MTGVVPIEALLVLADLLLFHGAEPTRVTGFPNPGTYLIFGIILVPVYVMLTAWFFGRPSDLKSALLGCGVFFGLITAVWVTMFFAMELVGIIFY